jgi:hypothetical protein
VTSQVKVNQITPYSGTTTTLDSVVITTGTATLTGGTITGITDLAVADGGTGASTAANARTNLGLGTGDSPQFTAIEVGAASDTTLSRASAGDVQVEGNRIFRVGGTDVPVADGGTGASTASAALTNLGGVDKTTLTTKGDVFVATAASTVVRQGVGNDGQAIHADSSQTNGVVYLDNPSRPNLLINPNWQIDQVNEGALYTVNSIGVNGPDGWSGDAVGTGVFKLRTLADPDNAALKCLEITCTTADVAIAATDTYSIYTAIEGYDAAALMAGTASATTITIQFKFKTNITGVYGVAIANSAKNRSYYGIITVADTSEHEYSLSLTMDTSGTWLYTNGVGLYLRLTLSAGSNFQGTAGAWASDAKTTTAAQCNFMSANTNVAYLKRIQLIPGALVQAYRPADIQKELAKAQRQYFKTFLQGTAVAQNAGVTNAIRTRFNGATNMSLWLAHPVDMRAAPTLTTYNPSAANANARDTDTPTDVTFVDTLSASHGSYFAFNSGATAIYRWHYTVNARLS